MRDARISKLDLRKNPGPNPAAVERNPTQTSKFVSTLHSRRSRACNSASSLCGSKPATWIYVGGSFSCDRSGGDISGWDALAGIL
jgi:hypothetical protein